nr:uncharacterized protein LOC122271334 [Parasteatoda tepidariorum]
MALSKLLALALVQEEINRVPKREIIPERFPALHMSDKRFISLYSVNKHIFLELCEKLRPMLAPRSCRRNAFSVETKLITALNFYASGSYQRFMDQDFTVCMSQQSVSNCILSVSSALNSVMNDYIRFPLQTR